MFKHKDIKEDNPGWLSEPPVIGECLRIQDVIGFFAYDLNPSYLDAKVEEKIAKLRKEQRAIPMGWIMMIAIIMIAGMVAYIGINGVLQGNTCNDKLLACTSNKVYTPLATSQQGGIIGAVQGATGSAGVGIVTGG